MINAKIMTYPGNWFRVGIMATLFFAALSIASGGLTKQHNQDTE